MICIAFESFDDCQEWPICLSQVDCKHHHTYPILSSSHNFTPFRSVDVVLSCQSTIEGILLIVPSISATIWSLLGNFWYQISEVHEKFGGSHSNSLADAAEPCSPLLEGRNTVVRNEMLVIL